MERLIFIIDSSIYTASLIGIYYLQLCISNKVISIIISVLTLLFSLLIILPMFINLIIGYLSGVFFIMLGGNKQIKLKDYTIGIIYYLGMFATLALIWFLCPIYNLQNILVCISSTALSMGVWIIKTNSFQEFYNSTHPKE